MQVVDVMLVWDLFEVALNILVNYSSGTYDDWYYFYFLVPYSLAFYLGIHILAHLLSGLLLDVVVAWYSHINDHTSFTFFLLCYQACWLDDIWLVTLKVSICLDLVVPQDGCFLIFHYLYWIMLVPVLCVHFDAIVLAYV